MHHTIQLASGSELSYLGPPLEKGALPAVFYFALSAEESLTLDPYNQPALALGSSLRVFSLDLPAHGKGKKATQAISVWAEEIAEGRDPLSECIERASSAIDSLLEQGVLIKEKIGLMGLSRGAFIACHVAASLPYLRHILGFAPLTRLSLAKEFQGMEDHPTLKKLSLSPLISSLFDRHFRFYIGNHDTRVGTRECFQFTEALAQSAFEHQIRSPAIELFIVPSIGQFGHGTSKESFLSGAAWLKEALC